MEREIQQRIVITGTSSGIGKTLAERYAAYGATLGLIARREPDLEQLASRAAALSPPFRGRWRS